MEILSNSKIENILSITGNNLCIECESQNVDWVSFPFSVFLCLNCCKRHKEFKIKPTLKSLSISEFTPQEIKSMSIGGNTRFISLMNEYKISLKEPNIESKYRTIIALYYYRLLQIQVKKIEKKEGADEIYNKILKEKPNYEIGKIIPENLNKYIQDEEEENNKNNSTFNQWFGFLGEKLNNISEVINSASNHISNTMEDYGIKDKLNKAIDYSKMAGGYVIDKAKEVSNTPIIIETKEKLSQMIDEVKNSAINIINKKEENKEGNNI